MIAYTLPVAAAAIIIGLVLAGWVYFKNETLV